MASKQEVQAFLDDFKTKMSICTCLYRDDRGKNAQALADLEIRPADRDTVLRELEVPDFSHGPVKDALYGGSEMLSKTTMKSPVTGKEMSLQKEVIRITFRKEELEVVYHYWFCRESGEQFTSTDLDEKNMLQVYNKYREAHHLPFPEQIKAIREKYGVSALKMSEILGFGVNMYRSYENGEVPSASNARLIQLANDPLKFYDLASLSGVYNEQELIQLKERMDSVRKKQQESLWSFNI